MGLRKDYPYMEANNDFWELAKRVVKDEEVLEEFRVIFGEAKANKTFPMRGLHKKLMDYRKKSGNYINFTQDERDMIEDLLHFWG